MAIEIKVPEAGESIIEVMIGEWLKKEGDYVEQDEPLVLIDTDKTSMEIPAPQAGVIKEILKHKDEDAEVGEVIGYIDETASRSAGEIKAEESGSSAAEDKPVEDEDTPDEAAADDSQPKKGKAKTKTKGKASQKDSTAKAEEDQTAPADDAAKKKEPKKDQAKSNRGDGEVTVMPAARRLLEQHGLAAADIEATGPGGRLLKEDVQRHLDKSDKSQAAAKNPKASSSDAETKASSPSSDVTSGPAGSRDEESVRMTPLRRRVAERLVSAQQNAALLTTFNEVDMSQVMALRQQYKEGFLKKNDIKLGFMSFFVKAAIEALKAVPQVNAEIREDRVVYRNYQDIGVAVGGGKGLVVPVIRNAERLSFAEVEKTIADLAVRARDNKLKLEELQGGTFTISNGGIYGSLLSTPIVNPPQSGILGMHKIEDRPVAVDGQVVVRPMMYLALTYDHRLIDGREAVTFLIRIKECIEDPSRILLEV